MLCILSYINFRRIDAVHTKDPAAAPTLAQVAPLLTDEDDQLGLFVCYAKADPQHDATILVQSSDGQIRGLIASQPQLYEQLIASRRATCYGLVRKTNDDYRGEVCIRIR